MELPWIGNGSDMAPVVSNGDCTAGPQASSEPILLTASLKSQFMPHSSHQWVMDNNAV